jgi:hypothetical protein
MPLILVAGLKLPPAGLTLQLTPALSLEVALRLSGCVTVTPAWAGVMLTEMFAGLKYSGSATDSVCAGLPESVTVNVSGVPPVEAAVGDPEIMPAGLKVRPAGSVPPVRLQLTGGVPPLTASDAA